MLIDLGNIDLQCFPKIQASQSLLKEILGNMMFKAREWG